MSMLLRRVSFIAAFASLLLAAAPSRALPSLPPNGTETFYDVGSERLVFSYDMDSPYELVGSDVILLQDDVLFDDLLVGTIYEFVIPNFYDPLPRKDIWITMLGANGGSIEVERPHVLDIIGSDAPFGTPGPSSPVIGSLVERVSEAERVFETWELFPNPDWEVVKIYAPIQFELTSILIVTQSVPEPGSAALLAAGLLGLAVAGRRRS